MIGPAMAAAGVGVSMLVGSFAPAHVDVVAGDTVTWTNDSVRRHTATALDGAWSSPEELSGDRYARVFDHTGAVSYYCRIHPFMRGEVDVHSLLLAPPSEPAAPRRPYALEGRSALPAGTAVAIEGDDGSGFHAVAQTAVGEDGRFRASVVPVSSASYRAVAGDETTPPVQLLVLDRHVTATSRVAPDGRTEVRVRVDPASPRATVVLQLHLRERFGWWPERLARLDGHSTATFRLTLHRRLRARAVLTLADGATPLARSTVMRVGRAR